MNENPTQIAEHLAEQHGLDGALAAARDAIMAAQANGNNYQLSIWREVRKVLRGRPDAGVPGGTSSR